MKRSTSATALDHVRSLTLQTAAALKRELENLDGERKRVLASFSEASEQIMRTLRSLGHAPNGTPTVEPKRRTKRRIRRGPEELKSEAQAIIELVKQKGRDGATGKEIRQQYPKVEPDIKGFVQKHGNRKVKTTGNKATMRYFVL